MSAVTGWGQYPMFNVCCVSLRGGWRCYAEMVPQHIQGCEKTAYGSFPKQGDPNIGVNIGILGYILLGLYRDNGKANGKYCNGVMW